MSDDPLDSIPAFDRISIRAVLVEEGEDPGQALFDAGIYDPVAIPVSVGDAAPDMQFGDGFTANPTGVLEPEEAEDVPEMPATGAVGARQTGATQPPAEAATITLPPAFGLQPLAPVRRPV